MEITKKRMESPWDWWSTIFQSFSWNFDGLGWYEPFSHLPMVAHFSDATWLFPSSLSAGAPEMKTRKKKLMEISLTAKFSSHVIVTHGDLPGASAGDRPHRPRHWQWLHLDEMLPLRQLHWWDFNPHKSSSYKHLHYDSQPCTVLKMMTRCGLHYDCYYALSYGDEKL